jgi:hypothetical protein
LERTRSYIDRAGIGTELVNLEAIVRESGKDPRQSREDVANQFLNVLQEGSAENFAMIEQVNGTWDQRLRRYYDQGLLGLDKLGPEIQELMLDAQSDLNAIYETVLERRPDESLNAFQDAAALTTLARYVKEWKGEQRTFLARFNTETNLLAEAIRDPRVAERLTYPEIPLPVVNFTPPPEARSVYRNSDYFMMRAIIEELSPLDLNQTTEKLGPIIDWAAEIRSFLEDQPSPQPKQVGAPFADGRLAELLRRFEKIGLLEPFWFRGHLPEFLAKSDTLANWMSVFRYASEEFPRQVLHARISDIRGQLKQEVAQLRTLARNFNMVVKARDDRRKSLSNNMENPMRDLGLVRWGYDTGTAETAAIQGIIGRLATEGDSALPSLARDIAERMELAKRSIPDCKVMAAVLWALARYSEMILTIELCRQNNRGKGLEFPRTLLLLRLAALMREGNLISEDQRRDRIREAKKILEGTAELAKKKLLLSAGYIMYQAWKQQMLSVPEPMRKPELQTGETRAWAEECFDLGERAYHILDPNSLAWAYAINHCAYVGTITGVRPDTTKEFVLRLAKLESIAALWNPRFDDTLGIYYLVQAQRKWDSSSAEERDVSDLAGDLTLARDYLNRAKLRNPGDIDIEEHLLLLRIFSNEIDAHRKSHTHPATR